MKNPEEYFDKIPYDFRIPNAKEWICEQILSAQKDAYNNALLDIENITPEGWISIVEVKKLKIK